MKLILDEKKIRKGRAIGLPYQGSKKKISKKIIEIIKQNFGTDKTIYDLFGGGGAITFECVLNGLNFVYNDLDSTLAPMIEKILSEDREYLKTLIVSREEFFKIKDKANKSVDDSLKLLVNSFGNNSIDYLYGKKWSKIKYELSKSIIDNDEDIKKYKQSETYKRYLKQMESKDLKNFYRLEILERLNSLKRLQGIQVLQQLETVNILKDKNFNFNSKDYREFSDVKNSIIYLDPPYEGTRKYYKKSYLNYGIFYDWCKDMSKENIVLISGYEMPDDFEVVYEFTKARSTMQSDNNGKRCEKLFMVKKVDDCH